MILWTFVKFKKSILSLESLKWANLFKLKSFMIKLN